MFYQVYPRSFADSDGDGVGDLDGLTARLDYLEQLGVDAIWLNPVTVSPMADHGYDVADPRDIDPLFGGLAAFERLIARGPPSGASRSPWTWCPTTPVRRIRGFRRRWPPARAAPHGIAISSATAAVPAGALPPNNWTVGVRRAGLDPGDRTGRQSRPVVSAPLRHRAAGPELGPPGGLRRLREDAAVLAGTRRGRLPHRRGTRDGQAGRPARHAEVDIEVLRHTDDDPRFNHPNVHDDPPRHPHGRRRLSRGGDRRRGLGHRQRPLGGVSAARRTAPRFQFPADPDRLRRRPRSTTRSRTRWRPPRSKTPPRPGRCPTTTWAGRSPATAAARSGCAGRGPWRW